MFSNRIAVEKACGSTVWGEVAYALDFGERAINLWEIRGRQMVANREVNRIVDESERRDRLLKEFATGGTYHNSYQQELEYIKLARRERARCLVEIKAVESHLGRGTKTPSP